MTRVTNRRIMRAIRIGCIGAASLLSACSETKTWLRDTASAERAETPERPKPPSDSAVIEAVRRSVHGRRYQKREYHWKTEWKSCSQFDVDRHLIRCQHVG